MNKSISMYIGDRWVSLDRDKLETAWLIFNDLPKEMPLTDSLDATYNDLMDVGWTLSDAVLYGQAAVLVVINGIEL